MDRQHDSSPRHETGAPEAFQLRDGRAMVIRQIRTDDAIRLRQLHERLSPRTQRLRFFTRLKKLDPGFARHLATVDFVARAAFVASFPGSEDVWAVGRYEVEEAGSAEVAFVVHDDLQGLGLGTELLQHLAALARENGIQVFTATTLAENAEMLDVFRHSGLPCTVHFEGDTANVVLELGSGGA
jgi:GNAT superfamily N-acetyltransferase